MFQFFSYIGLYVPSVGTWMSQESRIWEHVYTKLVARDYFSYSDRNNKKTLKRSKSISEKFKVQKMQIYKFAKR